MIQNEYKYDEIGYAEKILSEGFQTKYYCTELSLLTLYYRDFLKYKPAKRKEELYKFCEKYYPGFDPVVQYKIINRALRSVARKGRLVSIGYVNIFEEDLKVIESYQCSYNCKKLMFTFLAYVRLDRYYRLLKFDKEYTANIFYATSEISRRVRDMAGFPQSVDIDLTYIPDLVSIGAVTVMPRARLYLNFMDKCPSFGEYAIEITDYDNVGVYYDYYNHIPKVCLCPSCGQPFKKKSNSQMFCVHCAAENRKEFMREYMNAYRA